MSTYPVNYKNGQGEKYSFSQLRNFEDVLDFFDHFITSIFPPQASIFSLAFLLKAFA